MPNMTVSIELVTRGAAAEIEVEVEFSYTPGSPGYFNAMTGDGEAPYGPEIEIERISWPYHRWVAASGERPGHFAEAAFDMPITGIPDDVLEDITDNINENYDPADDAPERD